MKIKERKRNTVAKELRDINCSNAHFNLPHPRKPDLLAVFDKLPLISFRYCNFTNFRCVKISVASDRRAFGVVQISVSVDAIVIAQGVFRIWGAF